MLLELHDFKKLTELPETATAFSNRGPWYNLTLVMRWKTPDADAKVSPHAHGLAVVQRISLIAYRVCLAQLRKWSQEVTTFVNAEEAKLPNSPLRGNRGVRASRPASCQ